MRTSSFLKVPRRAPPSLACTCANFARAETAGAGPPHTGSITTGTPSDRGGGGSPSVGTTLWPGMDGTWTPSRSRSTRGSRSAESARTGPKGIRQDAEIQTGCRPTPSGGPGSCPRRTSHGSIMVMPLLVVRHAHAGRRSSYKGDDRMRPLTPRGRQRAVALVPLLSSFRPQRILSSPFVRCYQTVQPIAEALAQFIDRLHPEPDGLGSP